MDPNADLKTFTKFNNSKLFIIHQVLIKFLSCELALISRFRRVPSMSFEIVWYSFLLSASSLMF